MTTPRDALRALIATHYDSNPHRALDDLRALATEPPAHPAPQGTTPHTPTPEPTTRDPRAYLVTKTGAILRPEGNGYSARWNPDAGAWTSSAAYFIDATLRAATPEDLRAAGVPVEDWPTT